MNAVVQTTERQPRSVLVDMSMRYGMEPAAFEATVRATCMKPDKNGKVPTREEFAAFLLVAKEYKLNPLTKEIYAFPAKGGGIVPIVSLDGWANLINSHPAMDGVTFVMEHDDNNALVSCTCRIYRKDRSHPIEITEYLAECIRDTEPWKMRHRMLRHKSLIQCSRYAFGFSGIYDEDEGAKIAEMRDITPPKPTPPRPPVPTAQFTPPKPTADIIDAETGEVIDEPQVATETDEPTIEQLAEVVDESEEVSPSDMLTAMDDEMSTKTTEAEIHELWNTHDILSRLTHVSNGDEFTAIAKATFARHLKRAMGHGKGK